MKRLLILIIACLMMAGMINVVLLAEEQKDEAQLKLNGKAVFGGQTYSEQDRSSKFFEYRDVPKGFVFKYFDLNFEKGDKFFNFIAKNVRQRNSNYIFSMGEYGKYNFDLIFDRIPHRFSYEGKTLFVEAQPGWYTLADQVQKAAENSGSLTKTYPIISDFLTGAHPIDLDLQRDRAELNFNYNISAPLRIKFHVANEDRKGNRPFGASFGFNYALEVPGPIDYRTTNFDANLEYTRSWGTVRGGFFASSFNNDIEELVWDNFYRLNDRTYEGSYVSGDATSRGRMALPPSNFAQKFYLNGSFKVFKSARVNASFSIGQFKQDRALLPYTINTALEEEYANALGVPRNTAEAKANIASINLNFNTRIMKNVYLGAGFSYYNFDNKTTELEIEGYSRFDAVWEFVPSDNEPFGFQPTKYYADLTFNVLKGSSVKVGYSFYSIKREHAHHDAGSSDDGTFKLSFDSNPLDWLNLRVGYSHSKRDWSLEGKEFIYAPGFNFKRYHEADRNRDAVNLLVNISPVSRLDCALSYMLGNDKYPNSDYGLKSNKFAMYGIDIGYNIKENSTVYLFFYNENYKGEQASRQSGAVISTRTIDDWTAELKDVINTAGLGFNTPLKKEKLFFDVYYAYSKAKGSGYLFSPPGGTPDVATQFTAGLDTTTLNMVKLKATWKMNSHFSYQLGYWYEQYDLDDIVRNNMKIDAQGSGGGIYLNALEPSYKYHVGFINFVCTW